ncbi:MAG TPA: hypothetical protein VHV30_10250 [Polyangiaceae bacterium]|jgi:hypothetical protein|nr:hypothetical protein [Polyangiaceae bacterium]
MGVRTSGFRAPTLAGLGALACLSLGAAGCSSSSSPAPAGAGGGAGAANVFVGNVAGTDAQVGIVAGASQAVLYFCGGDGSYETKTHWIPSAAVSGAAFSAASDPGGWSISGTLGDAGASGSVVMGDGGTFAFSATPVAAQTIAGLYKAIGPCGTIGVIATQASPGDTPAIQGACLPASGSSMGSVEQVNPVMPIQRATDGTIAVSVGGSTVAVKAVTSAAE